MGPVSGTTFSDAQARQGFRSSLMLRAAVRLATRSGSKLVRQGIPFSCPPSHPFARTESGAAVGRDVSPPRRGGARSVRDGGTEALSPVTTVDGL